MGTVSYSLLVLSPGNIKIIDILILESYILTMSAGKVVLCMLEPEGGISWAGTTQIVRTAYDMFLYLVLYSVADGICR